MSRLDATTPLMHLIGTGLDVRKRKIWDFFEGSTLLEEPVDPRYMVTVETTAHIRVTQGWNYCRECRLGHWQS